MDKRTVLAVVERFRQCIAARGITPQKVILYGSHASGSNSPESDIDIVVISEDFAGKSYWERIDILADVIYEIFAPLEAVAMTPDEWERGDSFIVDFARNGEVLYAARGRANKLSTNEHEETLGRDNHKYSVHLRVS
jgi:uncharacterized protein